MNGNADSAISECEKRTRPSAESAFFLLIDNYVSPSKSIDAELALNLF